jgi:hypothetical protein
MITESQPEASFGTQIALVSIEMSGISPRADTINTLMKVFKAQGVEVDILDEEIVIRYKKAALLALQDRLKPR